MTDPIISTDTKMTLKEQQRPFNDILLKDALEGIHKAVNARLGVIGGFLAFMGGLLSLSFQQKASLFLILSTLILVALLIAEKVQRDALCSYYFRYIQIAHRAYEMGSDYVWLAGFTPFALLHKFQEIASDEHADTKMRARNLTDALGTIRSPSFIIITFVITVIWGGFCLYLVYKQDWPLLPVTDSPKTVVG